MAIALLIFMRNDNKQSLAKWIMKRLYSSNCIELLEKDPFIISCGGIFIPHKRETSQNHHYILMCAKEQENVKVISEELRNPLFDIISKENKN